MKTTDFTAKISSSKLKENINKMFGVNVSFDKYSREQLEDMRNKLRTRVFQQEGSAGINDLLTNETYQKDKAMLDLLNTRIKEMLGEDIKKLRDKMTELSEAKKGVRAPKHKIHTQGTAAKDYDGDGKKESPKDEVWGSRAKAAAKTGKPFEEGKGSKPDFLDMDKDGDKKEPMKKAVANKKAGPKKGVNPFAKVKEGFPTVDDAKKAAAGTASMKAGEKKKSSTGGEITKTATGLKHTAGKNYGGADAPKAPDSDKKAKKVKETSHQAATTMKHVKNPTAGEKKAAKDIKAGTAGYRDRIDMLKSAEKDGRLKESNRNFKHNVKFVNESLGFLLAEDEEGKAKAITAAGDMVNDYTSWMQRVGQYQTKTMIELADAIKADFGAAEAEAFKQAVGPALSATLDTLTQQREAVSNAVAVLAGEATPDTDMGMEPSAELPPEPGMDIAAPDEMNPPTDVGDEFGASDAGAGAGTTGREMRESRQQRIARKLAESHSIISKLAK
jgi:hypothetical protein